MNELNEFLFDPGTLDAKSGVNKYKTEKPKEGVNVYRILPPYGTNHGRSIFHKYMVHWGLIGSKGSERSYSCSYPTEGSCPICIQVFQSKKELEKAKQQGDEEQVKILDEYINKFQARTSFIYNAVTLDGRVIKLELGKMAHEELIKLIKLAISPTSPGAKPYDPTNIDNGVWFEIHKTGKGRFGTKYSANVRLAYIEKDGETFTKPDRGSLPLPADVVEEIKHQVEASVLRNEVIPGPMADIHSMHEPMTGKELLNLMNGGTAKDDDKPAATTTATKQSGVQSEIERLRALQAHNFT